LVAEVLRKLDYKDGWVAVHLPGNSHSAVRVMMIREEVFGEFVEVYGGRFAVVPRGPADGFDGWLLDTPLVRWVLFLHFGEEGLECRVVP